MPYIFPKRALRTDDVLDPSDLDDDFTPAADKLGGKLNEHDFRASATFTSAAQAFYIPRYVSKSVDTGIAHNAAGPQDQSAAAAPDNAWNLPNDYEWHRVGDMLVSATMSTSSLYVIGWGQYYRGPGQVQDDLPSSQAHGGADVQFALRIDGRIIEWTITGRNELHEKGFASLRPSRNFNLTGGVAGWEMAPGPSTPRYEYAAGLGPHLNPFRLGTGFNIQGGAHTVELVARRIPDPDDPNRAFSGSSGGGWEDVIQVYTRKLLVLECPTMPQASTSFAPISVAEFSTEDDFDNASMQTARADALRNGYNNVEEGMVSRGAFNHNHLDSPVIHAAQASIGGALSTVDTQYLGYTSDVLAGAKLASTGWWLIDDNAGANFLQVYGPGGAGNDWDITTEESFIVVLGNLHIRHLENSAAAAPSDRDTTYAFVALGYQEDTTGATFIVDDTIGVINNSNNVPDIWGHADDDKNVEADVPVFMFLDYTGGSFPPANDLNYIAMYINSAWFGSAAVPDVKYQNGNLLAIQLRA